MCIDIRAKHTKLLGHFYLKFPIYGHFFNLPHRSLINSNLSELHKNLNLLLSARTAMWPTSVVLTEWENDQDSQNHWGINSWVKWFWGNSEWFPNHSEIILKWFWVILSDLWTYSEMILSDSVWFVNWNDTSFVSIVFIVLT